MRKFIPSILIVLIFANIFAPLTLDTSTKTPTIRKSIVEAGDIDIRLNQDQATENSINISFHVTRYNLTDNHGLVYLITDKKGTVPIEKSRDAVSKTFHGEKEISGGLFSTPADAKIIKQGKEALSASKEGEEQIITIQINENLEASKTYYVSYAGYSGTVDDGYTIATDTEINTTAVGETDNTTKELSRSIGADGYLPWCAKAVFNVNIPGCIAQVIYTLLFRPTSFLFGLAGKFFDFAFFYSVKDGSYRTSFVVEGWAVVRDFVNMFFIFVLLYIAFKTILDIGGGHGPNTKQMIINVVIIGLLINFSLFATQIIIDTSNILARVFYNSDSIVTGETKDASGSVISKPGENGEIQLSAALVTRVNPQTLILDAAKVSGENSTNGISDGTFILVTLLATAVNIVGLIVFLSVGIIFIGRVIGLWLAMIFAPLAFFSYTVPPMQGVDTIGWTKWWPNTLKLAFLAPIFIFFMYLIIKFLGTNFLNIQGAGGAEFVIKVIVPFAFIMILLNKAKGLAVKFSGDVGAAVTSAVKTAGGVALGGAALTAAFAGRQTIGAVSKYVQNDSARNNALNFKSTTDAAKQIKGWNTLNPFAYLNVGAKAVTGAGKFIAAGAAVLPSRIGEKVDPLTGQKTNWFQRKGSEIGDKTHATHVLDEKAQALKNDKTSKYSDLTESEQRTVRDRVDRDIVSKESYNKVYDKLTAPERQSVDAQQVHNDPKGSFAQAASMAQTQAYQNRGDHLHTANDLEKSTKADTAVGEFVNALRRGSYDLRNLSKTKAVSKGFFPTVGVGLASALAGTVRNGLKKGLGIEHGTGQKDFFKDLGHTVSEALKAMKVEIKVDGGGHSDSHDDHGGGGHH